MTRAETRQSQKAQRFPSLYRWMAFRGMSEGQVADAIHVDRGQFSRILNGKESLRMEPAFRLALLTDIPVEELATGGEAQKILKLYADRLKSTTANAPNYVDVA